MTDFIIVYVTAGNEEDAAVIGRDLVDRALAGCVTIIRGVRSIYRWQGATQDEPEVLMVIKTRRELFGPLAKRVKELHKYSVPEIVALPILSGSDEYLGWLDNVTEKNSR